MEVVRLDARTDFRLEKLDDAPVCLTPADADARAGADKAFPSLTRRRKGSRSRLPMLGREIVVPQAAGHVARFDYADLCRAAARRARIS